MLPPACLDLPYVYQALIGYIDGACSESADSREGNQEGGINMEISSSMMEGDML
jgi:hypothetical protein